jgi:hypothetical protein
MESFFKIVKICFKDKYRKYQVISSRGYLRDIILLFNHDTVKTSKRLWDFYLRDNHFSNVMDEVEIL